MKAVKEALSPTRVRLTVEVDFAELKPSLDTAYRKVARQVRIQGFRPGKVPPPVLDRRVGRGVILDEAIQDAVPHFYSEAARDQDVHPLGRPDVDVTSFADGAPLVFTAEVDVRPEIELPDYDGLEVSVPAVDVTDDDVDQHLNRLRDRFARLEGVERPAALGDYVTIDLSAAVDGEPLEAAAASGVSYEVGSHELVDGLDEAVTGASGGDTRTFTTTLAAGEHAGQTAEVTATVRSVKRKILPELDDDFATTASEFDTMAELRADVRTRLERAAQLEQAVTARTTVLDVLVERAAMPLPESVVDAEVEARRHDLDHQLEEAEVTLDTYLAADGKTEEELTAELRTGAVRGVTVQFLMDAIAEREHLTVSEQELTSQLLNRAARSGVRPQEYVDRLARAGQLPAVHAEVLRGKALAHVLEHAKITDSAGRAVDLSALTVPVPAPTAEPVEEAEPPTPHDDVV